MTDARRAAVDSLPPTGPAALPSTPEAGRTAGQMLRAARERQDLHLDVLAATIKVSAAKLQALEEGRYEDLPNATFVRALAQSVCRSLKIDPRPVLAQLPQAEAPPLEGHVGRLNTPFREPPGRGDVKVSSLSAKPLFIAAALLLVAAVVVYFLPPSMWARKAAELRGSAPANPENVVAVPVVPAPQPAAPAATSTVPMAEQAASAPAIAPPAAEPAASAVVVEPAPALPPPGTLQIAASATSWIEIVDGAGQVVLSRTFQAGETLGLDAPLPLRLKVGNAAGTRITLRGQVVDLAPVTRDNVARIELR